MQKVLTNKIKAEYNYENIDRDFDIFMVAKESAKLDKTNVLDIPLLSYKALAVQYAWGKKAFVLFKKGQVNEFQFRNDIQSNFDEVTVSKVNIFDEEFRSKNFFVNDRLLAQLLMNSIKSPRSEKFAYHNLTGALFYMDSKWLKKDKEKNKFNYLHTLKVELTPGMYLKLSVKTFRLKYNERGKREYIFDAKTGNFRKKIKDDEKGDIYIEASFKNSHKTIKFLQFDNVNIFNTCKLGVMRKFLSDVENRLGDYLTLSFEYKENVDCYAVSKEQKKAMDNKHLSALIDRPVHIVDELNTQLSQEAVEKIKEELETFYNLSVTIGEIDSKAYNIRIIHNDEYYDENEITDLHNNIPDDTIIQHITLEGVIEAITDKKKSKKKSPLPMLNKVLQELVIKKDVLQKYVSVFDWKNLNFDKTWTFVIRRKSKTECESNKKSFDYIFLDIDKTGEMNFSIFSDKDKELSENQKKILYSFERLYQTEKSIKNEVEGLVFSDIDNIHAISRTPMTTIPDINAIYNGLSETDEKGMLSEAQISNALFEFEIQYPEFKEYADKIKVEISEISEELTKKKFKSLMAYQTNKKAAQTLNRFLHSSYGIRIMPEIKAQYSSDVYLIDNILDIKYYTEINYKNEKEFHYFIGTKREALQTSVHNACTIRKVITESGNFEFEQLFPLLAVDFVRNNQHTVLPFPFKFLREYAAMIYLESESDLET